MLKHSIFGLIFLLCLGACNAGSQQETSSLPKIKLPVPDFTGKMSVEAALKARRSVRTFADAPITLREISQLLWAAYGITQPMPAGPAFLRGGKRTAPSAGALYPLEIYLVVTKISGVPAGIYYYNSENHLLETIQSGEFRAGLAAAALGQAAVRNAPVTLVYAAEFERSMQKYGKRARERYVWLEAGHAAQNVCLQATALNLGNCVLGAFDDESVTKVINLPEIEEPLYLQVIGRLP